jgi:acetyltransferase-like isoleucine patch superfamily enzyme
MCRDNPRNGEGLVAMSDTRVYRFSGVARAILHRARRYIWKMIFGWRYMELGRNCMVVKPILVTPRFIKLKDRVIIHAHGRVQGITSYQGVRYAPEIIFDQGSSAQQSLHLTCAERVYIGKETALAANVTISDIDHPYEDVDTPIEKQPLRVAPTSIGDGCKIYNNAVILPGTTIGDHCVVGANSVVSGSFDSFSVIVGAPARTVKRYDASRKTWVRVP